MSRFSCQAAAAVTSLFLAGFASGCSSTALESSDGADQSSLPAPDAARPDGVTKSAPEPSAAQLHDERLARDARDELKALGRGQALPPSLKELRQGRGFQGPITAKSLSGMPVPGGIGAGTTYLTGQLAAHTSANLTTKMIVYPAGFQTPDWLFTTATNRTGRTVEVVGIYNGNGPGSIGVFDWSCSPDSPCSAADGSQPTGPSWIWTHPLSDTPCYYAPAVDGAGAVHDTLYYSNVTDQTGSPWKNKVYFWNSCTNTLDLVYSHAFSGTQEDCSATGACGWWGPIIETFFDLNGPTPIPELGFFETSLVHDGVTSLLPPSETNFSPPAAGWNTCFLQPNRAWGTSNLACPAPAKPDLVVLSSGYVQSSVTPGQPMTFQATVKNQGFAPIPAGTIVGVSFKVDGAQVSWSDNYTQGLQPGQVVTVTANGGPGGGNGNWTSTFGAHSLEAWVDDVNRVVEADENNNKLTTPFTVGRDLIVTQVSYSPTNAAPGTPVTFSATIKNMGTQATPAGTIAGVSFAVDGTQVSWSDTYTQSLAPGQSVTLTSNSGPQGRSTWTAAAGAHSVEAWVDDVNRIAEGNENNNKLTAPVSIGIDLTVTSLSYSPASPHPGNAVTFSAVVKNVGTQATPAGTIVGVAFNVDGNLTTWSDTYTQSLAPGASVTLTANSGPSGSSTWTASAGTHALQGWVDDVNRLNDVNRNNNKLVASVTVQ